MSRETKVPQIPAITKDNVTEVLQAIKDILEVREGARGDALDENATFRDLLALRLVESGGSISRASVGGNGSVPVLPPGSFGDGYDPNTDLTTPPAPTNLIARPGITTVLLFWDNATYRNHAYTEIWRSETDTLGDAVRVATTSAFSYSDAVQEGTTYYYWVRFVSVANVIGPYNATSGTIAETRYEVAKLLNVLSGQITESQLYTDLGARIDLIDGPIGLVGSVNARIGAVQTQVNDLAGTSEYDNGTTYQVNAIVKYNGGLYRAKSTTTGNLPTNTTYWDKIGDYSSIGEAVAGLAVQMTDRYTKAETNSAISSATSSLVSSNTLNQALGQKNRTYRQANQPDPGSSTTGDLWFDSDDNNKAYRFNGTSWEATDDARIGSTLASLTNDYYTKTSTDQAIASATSTLVSSTALSNALANYTTTAGLTASYYTKTATDQAISAATANLVSSSTLNNYVQTATLTTNYYTKGQTDGAISNSSSFLVARMDTSSSKTFYQSATPVRRGYDTNNVSLPLVTGDTWVDTANGNRQYTWNGTSWVLSADTRIQDAFNAAAAAQAAADGTIKTYFQTTAPTGLTASDVGDLWFDTDDTNKIYRWNGSSWSAAQDTRIATAIADASNALSTSQTKITTFFQTSQPTATTVGDLWIDTDDNNQPYRWNGSSWVSIRDGNIAAVDARVTNVERAKIGYATRNSTGLVYEGNGSFVVYPVATYPDATFPEYAANRTTIIDKVGADRWNAAFPADQVTWRIGLPIATAVKQVSVSDGSQNLTLEQRFTAQRTTNTSLLGQYTVKIDNNGHVSGFGLASGTVNGTPSSAFIVRADRFALASPTDTSNPLGTLSPTQSSMPFMVFTTPTTITIGGKTKTYPAGVWMNTAFIADATIDSANIESLTANKITAGEIAAAVSMTAPVLKYGPGYTFGNTGFFLGNDGGTPKFYVGNGSDRYLKWDGTQATISGLIYAGGGQIGGINIAGGGIASANYIDGSAGFAMNFEGYAQFNNVSVRGNVVATSGTIGGNVIDTTGLRSSNYVAGNAGWRINSSGSAEFRNIIARGDIEASTLKANTVMVETLNINGNAVTVPFFSNSAGGTFTPSAAFSFDTSSQNLVSGTLLMVTAVAEINNFAFGGGFKGAAIQIIMYGPSNALVCRTGISYNNSGVLVTSGGVLIPTTGSYYLHIDVYTTDASSGTVTSVAVSGFGGKR